MKYLEDIIGFVSGNISTSQFEKYLYASSDMEKELSDESLKIPPYTDCGSAYLYLISINYNDVGNLLNAQDLLSQFLDKKGVAYHKADTYKKLGNIIYKAQPKWLDLPGDYADHLLQELGDMADVAMVAALREKIAELFCFMSKPPKWIQSPAWPIEEGSPLFFIGQLKLEGIRLDDGVAYMFLNKKTGTYQVIEQFY